MSSFFGFDPSLPRDKSHNASAHGFGQAPDVFAGLSSRDYEADEDAALDFEDTYDGLGDHLDDADDALNADTFGSGPITGDFDFSGQTSGLTGAAPRQAPPRQEPRYQPQTMQQAPPARQTPQAPRPQQPLQMFPTNQMPKPARSGYERYKEPDAIPKLEASASIWGQQAARSTPPVQQQPQQQQRQATPQQNQPTSISNVTRKMMSLDEVEAMMRAQSQKSSPLPPPSSQQPYHAPPQVMPQRTVPQQPGTSEPPGLYPQQQPPSTQSPIPMPQIDHLRSPPGPIPGQMQPPQILQRPQPENQRLQTQGPIVNQHQRPLPSQHGVPPQSTHARNGSHGIRQMINPQQILQMSEQERAAFLEEDARRAKRNHKIHLLSKDNGLMTPQDKNFITRIQLQQLLTATGNVDEEGPEAALAEDFYYQIYSQIRGTQINPNQQLSQFAQTYLHQTSGRTGNRRYARGSDQIRRMEQQVQRAVEAAKAKPKNKQLVIEGSLGKISFSNAKTPKPLLNLRRQDGLDRKPVKSDTAAGRKATLRTIEAVYTAVLKMEEHERRMPRQTTEESSADEIQEQIDWRARIQHLNAALWNELKVMEPIDPGSGTPHPFIAILSHPKGKKVLPRVFRQIDDQQRLTVLTMIVIHLDSLDVVRLANPTNEAPLPTAVRDEVELFSQTVMHCLFGYVSDAPLGILVGLLGLILERVNVQFIARTKIGLGLLTIFLSRAELIKENGQPTPQDSNQFNDIYNGLFDILEPVLPTVFTTPINAGDDVYVWQFLAAVGISANPEQQQRLVLGVKDRVMDTVTQAKQLPEEVGRPRLDNVNLFMKAIGLDVELLG